MSFHAFVYWGFDWYSNNSNWYEIQWTCGQLKRIEFSQVQTVQNWVAYISWLGE